MGESVAHLHALWFARPAGRHVGDDGVYRFAPAEPALATARAQATAAACPQLAARRLVVRHHRAHDVPEARAVVHLAQVASSWATT